MKHNSTQNAQSPSPTESMRTQTPNDKKFIHYYHWKLEIKVKKSIKNHHFIVLPSLTTMKDKSTQNALSKSPSVTIGTQTPSLKVSTKVSAGGAEMFTFENNSASSSSEDEKWRTIIQPSESKK